MANKSINALVNASGLDNDDLLVLWDSGTNTAQNMTGAQFAAWLVSLAEGHGGIESFVVVDSGTAGDGRLHTATLTYAGDHSTYTFTFRDGYKGDTGPQTYVHILYADKEPTSDADMGVTPDSWIGIYVGTEIDDPYDLHYTDLTWYEFKGPRGYGVSRTERVSVVGLEKTYKMYTEDGAECGEFTVTDGEGAVSLVNNLAPDSQGNVKVFVGTVTDLGLTAGSATISAAYTALQPNQVLIAPSTDFASDQLPLVGSSRINDGCIEISKGANTDGWIEFHGRQVTSGDFRMFFTSADVPTGTWVPTGGNVDFSSTIYFNYGDPLNVLAIRRNGVVYLTVQSTSRVWAADNSVCTIPAGFRPPTQIQFPASASAYNATVYIQAADGDTKVGYIGAPASTATRIIFTVSYPL